MRSIALLLACLPAIACSSPTELDDRWAVPEDIQFANSLQIDLDEMNRTASGLYWQDLSEGTGAPVAVGQTVVLHYRGWLPNGTLFDSSLDRDVPIEFYVGGGSVIAGLEEGVVGMQPGGTRKLVIPPELAYGTRGKGPIPPLATVIFELELISIRP